MKSPPGVHSHKLRVVDGDILYVNSERLGGEKGLNARTGLFIFDISKGGEPKQIGFYDTPGTGPHRFGVDNKRKLAFLPNDAPGWNKRVIWTLDIKNPEKPEVISQWGLPWMKAADGVGEVRQRAAARGSRHAARPADDPRQPHVRGVVGRRHLGDRLLRPVQHEAGRAPVLGAALPRLEPHLLADRRQALPRSSPTRRAPSRNTGTRSSCGSSTRARRTSSRRSRPSCRTATNTLTAPAATARTTSWSARSRPTGRGRTSCSSPTSTQVCARSTSAIRSIPKEKSAATSRRWRATARRCSRTTSAPTSTAGSI